MTSPSISDVTRLLEMEKNQNLIGLPFYQILNSGFFGYEFWVSLASLLSCWHDIQHRKCMLPWALKLGYMTGI